MTAVLPSDDQQARSRIAQQATEWYDRHARDLPWRRPGVSPWAVLVSEVMLQQTQVSRVEPVWRTWCERWPTPAALAAEPVAEAIRAWGRLGYPRRAVRLHGCAVDIVHEHAGEVPSDLASLLALPGIGTYTARAVAVFAFRQRHAVVDTNVRRLAARAVEGRAEAGPATTMGDLRAIDQLLPADAESAARASIAFMELGALVCTAKTPQCGQCPLAEDCAWRLCGGRPLTRGRRPAQRYQGSDRQVRGRLLAALRESATPVPVHHLDLVWHDPVQRNRALAGLVTDGLAIQIDPDHYSLPG